MRAGDETGSNPMASPSTMAVRERQNGTEAVGRDTVNDDKSGAEAGTVVIDLTRDNPSHMVNGIRNEIQVLFFQRRSG
jgi:hypothetical protein